MPNCCAYGCSNRTDRKRKGEKDGDESKVPRITFHKIPEDKEKRERWLREIRRDDFVPSPHTRICSEHFEEDCFDRTGQTTRLRESAVPTIFVFSSNLTKEPVNKKFKENQELPGDTGKVELNLNNEDKKEALCNADSVSIEIDMEKCSRSPDNGSSNIADMDQDGVSFCCDLVANSKEELQESCDKLANTNSSHYDHSYFSTEQKDSIEKTERKPASLSFSAYDQNNTDSVPLAPPEHSYSSKQKSTETETPEEKRIFSLRRKLKTCQQRNRRLLKCMATACATIKMMREEHLIAPNCAKAILRTIGRSRSKALKKIEKEDSSGSDHEEEEDQDRLCQLMRKLKEERAQQCHFLPQLVCLMPLNNIQPVVLRQQSDSNIDSLHGDSSVQTEN